MSSRTAAERNEPMRPALRLAEVVAALSLATDLGMGQPLEFALSSCVLAVRLGETLQLNDVELREVYYQALLRYIGCNAETHTLAALVGDELALRRDFATIDNGSMPAVAGLMLRYLRAASAGVPAIERGRLMAHGLMTMSQVAHDGFVSHCEVAQRLATRLGLGGGSVQALGQLYERWDGRGQPTGLKGDEIARSVRIVSLAQDAAIFHRIEGPEAAIAVVRKRRGTAYDPQIADRFCETAPRLLAGLEGEPAWDTVVALEPGQPIILSEEQFDTACAAMADFADIKSPFTLAHSHGVARLAAAAAHGSGLPETDVVMIRRAGLLHDLGRVSVSAGIWSKPGPLTEREWEHVRLHPYYTERVLNRPAALAALGALAGCHHERLDGSGYHRGARAATLPATARILAAADAYQAMTEARPHRPARSDDEAARELEREARAGRLDADATRAVLAAAGHGVRRSAGDLTAGLTPREVEVLRLISRGRSTKEIARELFIAEKTADNHIQHIYAKIGVTTRAGAALFAVEHQLLDITA